MSKLCNKHIKLFLAAALLFLATSVELFHTHGTCEHRRHHDSVASPNLASNKPCAACRFLAGFHTPEYVHNPLPGFVGSMLQQLPVLPEIQPVSSETATIHSRAPPLA